MVLADASGSVNATFWEANVSKAEGLFIGDVGLEIHYSQSFLILSINW